MPFKLRKKLGYLETCSQNLNQSNFQPNFQHFFSHPLIETERCGLRGSFLDQGFRVLIFKKKFFGKPCYLLFQFLLTFYSMQIRQVVGIFYYNLQTFLRGEN